MSSIESTDEIREVTLGDLRNTGFTETIKKEVDLYNVVIFFNPNSINGGSGTLVDYRGIKGILTASHVAAHLKQYIHLPCCLRKGTTDVWDIASAPFLRILTIDDLKSYRNNDCKSNWSENGLDISLIQIDDAIFDKILKAWSKQPLELVKMRSKYHAQEVKYWSPQNKHNWSWTIAGTPREGCNSIEQDVNYFPHPSIYVGGGETKLRINTLQNVESSFIGLEVDIIETQLGTTQDTLPKDFSGASGGGVYQTYERRIGDRFQIEEILLAGVFVAADENAGWLYSRGHIALYDIFCEFLDTQL